MTFPVPETLIRTSHALTIRVNGISVGLVNGWNPTQSKTITPAYQIGTFVDGIPSGEPVEKLPGNVTGMTIAVQRYDIYTQKMEEAFGVYVGDGSRKSLSMLTQQDRPFELREQWRYPDDPGGSEGVIYQGCWFSNIGKNYRSDGDRIVNVNATIEYTKRIITNLS
jgi:hypothetical protein